MTGRHLLSLLATGLALVLGLGLGAGPVSEGSLADTTAQRDRLQARADRLQARVAALRDERAADAAVVSALAEPLVGDRLEGRTVLVVATPGADPADVRRTRRGLAGAGADVTGTLSLRRTFVDPERAQSPLEDLALRLVPPGVEFTDGATPIQRVSAVLARAVVQRPDDGADPAVGPDQDGAEVIAGFDELDALTLTGQPGARAELAVVVTGTDEEEAADALLALVAALDAGSRGAVLVGPGDAQTGPLRWARDTINRAGGTAAAALSGISTVDGVVTTAGRVALVLALAEQLDGPDAGGAYGSGRRAEAVVPALG